MIYFTVTNLHYHFQLNFVIKFKKKINKKKVILLKTKISQNLNGNNAMNLSELKIENKNEKWKPFIYFCFQNENEKKLLKWK